MIHLKNAIKSIINKFGYEVIKSDGLNTFPIDFNQSIIEIILKVRPFTQTSSERISALYHAVNYIIGNNIAGDIVECGVWKGGSIMAVALASLELEDTTRNLYLFDTFEGMTASIEKDISIMGITAQEELVLRKKEDESFRWCYADLDNVKASVYSTGYPKAKIHFIKGKVEDTIPQTAPERISLLRLDTDWYESTKHELIHLFPRIVNGGVLIIDDYGHWQGAKQAVDEYIQEHNIKILLNRIDYTGRIGIVNHFL